MNNKKVCRKKGLAVGLLLLAVFAFAGCYSSEERALAREYKKQAKVNAVNYVNEKYGFEATVKSVWIQGPGEFGSYPGKFVFVTMKCGDEEFVVKIAGDEETSEGFDNYQQEEILSALKDEVDTQTGVDSEEVFAVYGEEREYTVRENGLNGLVAPFFTGENLKEILTGGSEKPHVAVVYINQEIAEIDVEKIKEQTGINHFLFTDYDSEAHYEAILQSEKKQIWSPERNLPYVNEYLTVRFDETTYVNCEKKIVDGILFVTEYPQETVTAEKLSGFTDGFKKKNSRLVFDVYALETESDIVHVFVPIEALSKPGRKKPEFWIKVDGKEKYEGGNLTDDGKYVGATIYTRDYEGAVEFSVFVWED